MDDFRVGSVPSSEPYGDRHAYGSIGQKRHKHHEGHAQGEEEEPSDTFEASSESEDTSAGNGEPVEDYYLPSPALPDEE